MPCGLLRLVLLLMAPVLALLCISITPLGTFVGALAVGIFSNLFNRMANAPASIVAMQGLIVLVPGSKTYIGLNSLIEGQDFVYAEHIGQQTFLIFMSLVAGLIFANVALPPKKSL